jgi:hypothetical protein
VALTMHNNNKLKAAKELGISRCYLHRLLNQLEEEDGSRDDVGGQEEVDVQEGQEFPAVQVRSESPKKELSDRDAIRAVEPAKAFRSAVRIA